MFLTHLTSPDSPTYTLDNTSKNKIITNKLIFPKNESPCPPPQALVVCPRPQVYRTNPTPLISN